MSVCVSGIVHVVFPCFWDRGLGPRWAGQPAGGDARERLFFGLPGVHGLVGVGFTVGWLLILLL